MQIATLLPIAPILLLPFIIIFFVVVFPFWLVGAAVTWVLRLIVRLVVRMTQGAEAAGRPTWADRWFHWIITFGGFTEWGARAKPKPKE